MANAEHLEVVTRGAGAILRWRSEHAEERLDLRGVDLSLANLLGADLSDAELTGANLPHYVEGRHSYAARTDIGMKFDEIREKEGLGAALKWRAAQFAE